MRQIHSVSFHEKFVASGMYKIDIPYPLNTSYEHWTIHQLPDETLIVRTDSGNSDTANMILTETLYASTNLAGRIERADIQWFRPNNQVKITFSFFEDHVEILRTADYLPAEYEEISLPENYVIGPPGWINTAFFVPLAGNVQESTSVFSLSILPKHFIKAVSYSIKEIAREIYTIGTKDYQARVFEVNYYSHNLPNRPNVMTTSFDDYNVLLKHSLIGGQVLLTQYARRPEPPIS
jgi:hypothetical protein